MMISANFYNQMTEADRETVPMTYYIRWDDESWDTGSIELSRLEAEELNQESAAYVADYIYHHGTTEKSFFNEYSPIQPDEADLYINKIYIKCGEDIVTWFDVVKMTQKRPAILTLTSTMTTTRAYVKDQKQAKMKMKKLRKIGAGQRVMKEKRELQEKKIKKIFRLIKDNRTLLTWALKAGTDEAIESAAVAIVLK